MKKILKIFSLILVITALLFFTCLSIVLFNPRAMQNILMFGANKFLEEMTVRDLVIKHQVCGLPSRQLTFEDVSWTLEHGEESYAVNFKAVRISKVMNIIYSGKGVLLQLDGGTVKASTLRLEGLYAEILSENREKWAGSVSVKEAESNNFQVRDIQAEAVITPKEADISGINGDSYKGRVMGSVHVYFVPSMRYVADVTLEGLDTAAMENINFSFFSQVRGRIYGTIEVRGPTGGFEEIHMNVRLNEDGEIQANVLEPLLDYIPKSTQEKTLRAAVKNNLRIRVNNAQMKLANQDSETVSADIQLKSDQLNLDLNVTVDFIIEGGMQGLLKYFI